MGAVWTQHKWWAVRLVVVLIKQLSWMFLVGRLLDPYWFHGLPWNDVVNCSIVVVSISYTKRIFAYDKQLLKERALQTPYSHGCYVQARWQMILSQFNTPSHTQRTLLCSCDVLKNQVAGWRVISKTLHRFISSIRNLSCHYQWRTRRSTPLSLCDTTTVTVWGKFSGQSSKCCVITDKAPLCEIVVWVTTPRCW